jgi:acetyltransferase-like isoleucine patch superfamily enzyme
MSGSPARFASRKRSYQVCRSVCSQRLCEPRPCGLVRHQARRLDQQQVVGFGMPFATVVHPKAHVSPASTLGEGTFLSPGVIIAAHTTLGRHVRVNPGAC